MEAYEVRYRNKFGLVETYGLIASCVDDCRNWVERSLDNCVFLSARQLTGHEGVNNV